MPKVRRWVAGAVVASALAVTPSVSAEPFHSESIDPGTPVNGMLVVQGLEAEADVSLFGTYCDPIVRKPGRETRTCALLPPSKRIFIGYGIWGVSRKVVDQAWHKRSWGLWIDGQPVNLSRFGTSDRWLWRFPAANGRNVLLRLWSIILVGPKGRHSIRYRSRLEDRGKFSLTTWKFTVPDR